MIKGKEWLKEETEKLYKRDEAYFNPDDIVVENYQTVTSILELIDQLDEPEKVVIPQFVADWIEITKKSRWGILMLFDTSEMPNEEVDCWLTNTEDGPRNSELAARAWLGENYTIEQPKLLTVIVKDYDKTIKTIKLSEDEVNKMMEGLEC